MKNFKISISIIMISLMITLFLSNATNALTSRNHNLAENSSEKVVYLTFDDGPGGKVTLDVLDTLKKEGVPATFFVIGCQIEGQENTILRMKNEGHSIGLHSVSHDRHKLYSKNDGFLKEMMEEQKLLCKVTGDKCNILRFPFGCNNNTYKLSETMVELLHSNDLKIYNWTTDSGDGANPNSSPQSIIKNACAHKDNNSVIVLMHCSYIHKNTAKALPEIIKHYKSQGYTFKVINENTPENYKVTKK